MDEQTNGLVGMGNYHAPKTLGDALDHLARGPMRIIAGGTDVYPAQGDRPFRADMLDISRLDDLRGIEQRDGAWRIGALTTWADIARASLPAAFHGLQQAARQVGGVQIQNAGTIGGNLCNASPAADGVPPLLTLEAQVEITAIGGRRVLPLDQFLTGARRTALNPAEIVTALLLPQPDHRSTGAFVKLGSRRNLVISIAMAAACLTPDDNGGDQGRVARARLAVGACSAVAQRLAAAEAALTGAPWDAGALSQRLEAISLDELTPIDDVRGSADYRRDAARTLLIRAVAHCLVEDRS